MSNIIERSNAAEEFAQRWSGQGYEKDQTQLFWSELLSDVMGIRHPSKYISFELKTGGAGKKCIDAYIERTRVLIEQKSYGTDLNVKSCQSDGQMLNAAEQAQRYSSMLPYSLRPRWTVVCNFSTFHIIDMEKPEEPPIVLNLSNLKRDYQHLDFLVRPDNDRFASLNAVSVEAGNIVGHLYDRLLAQFRNVQEVCENNRSSKDKEQGEEHLGSYSNSEIYSSLNILCVRLVFCLFADDSGIFSKRGMFRNFIRKFDAQYLHIMLEVLFRELNTSYEERSPFLPDDLAAFPYVNGGLFSRQDIIIPRFTDEIKSILIDEAGDPFDWSVISPTIFGAVFESTINPDIRRKEGMHYTSIENIESLINPLFMDKLIREFEEIRALKTPSRRRQQLQQFQRKLADLRFLDPACGSGNFLTQTYISLRTLENEVLRELFDGRAVMGDIFNPIMVSIEQFYGIEIDDFAATVARTAMWISEAQMLRKTEEIVNRQIEYLPIRNYAHIVNGNALTVDWSEIVPAQDLSYIMGNPPFIGYSLQSPSQKQEVLSIWKDESGRQYPNAGKIDYVSAWMFKAASMMQGTSIHTAFVATNSVCQGDQVSSIWRPLFERFGVHFTFARRTFVWNSEALDKAHVHCVILGFTADKEDERKLIYGEGLQVAENINPYLVDAPMFFIDSRKEPLYDVPRMSAGNRPADGGHLILDEQAYDELTAAEPGVKPFIKELVGADEFIKGTRRYCLWFAGIVGAESIIRKLPLTLKRVKACKASRMDGAPDRQKLADRPWLFRETSNPDSYLIIPNTSSERREYIPMGFADNGSIPANSLSIIPDAQIHHFAVLTSSVHMAWMRTVGGRLKSSYRYSKDIVYNNFPWPEMDRKLVNTLKRTGQGILDARKLSAGATLADMYDPDLMPAALRKAHKENDKAVLKAYGLSADSNEPQIISRLFEIYQHTVMSKA